jgi:NTP pyrophosphatase (non-canonical NTP hydrolase)
LHLSQLQSERRVWVEKNFPGNLEIHSVLGMVEELGELSHAFLKREQGIRGLAEKHTAAIKDAVCDLIIFSCGIADAEGFDLGEAMYETWAQVKKRNWIDQPLDGMEQPEQTKLQVEGEENLAKVEYPE